MKTKRIKGEAFSLPQCYNKNKFNKANFGRSFLKRYFYYSPSGEAAYLSSEKHNFEEHKG